jgi:poly-gamma-glutamate capsule biosynthesis protein CapA/YwtB (metallophosphatase superfamily)
MSEGVRLFLCGDVMTGRGVDQVLPHPVAPALHEPYVRSATTYVELAERASGAIGRRLDFTYPWGDALAVLDARQPHARIVNLETAVTTSEHAQAGKGIHYRMHPANLPCLTGARIDCCVLANNHVLDWGRPGLQETLAALRSAGIAWAGAGNDAHEAAQPARMPLPGAGRLLVYGFAATSSGVPASWAAGAARAGVNLLQTVSVRVAERVAAGIVAQRQRGDLVVVSVHWGGNWGFDIEPQRRDFARILIETGAADVVHGHSSHHAQGIEVVQGKLVLYGCGDFINDYEGIAGHEGYRPDLAIMYLPVLEPASGVLLALELVPLRRRRLRLEQPSDADRAWLREMLQREGDRLGTGAAAESDGSLSLLWRGRSGHHA